MKQYTGQSYETRVREVNDIYNRYLGTGLSNREIWRRYVWPIYHIRETTFYNYLSSDPSLNTPADDDKQLKLFKDEKN